MTERKAKHGEKMIEVRLRFFTNNIADSEGYVEPKNAWTRGMVNIERNDAHQIVPGPWKHFNSLLEITGVIEKVFIQHNVKLHLGGKMKNYIAE